MPIYQFIYDISGNLFVILYHVEGVGRGGLAGGGVLSMVSFYRGMRVLLLVD